MKLHINKTLFSDTIRATAQDLNINEEFVEKDYWIALILNIMSISKYAKDVVFKGGTSLLKCYELIDRFSEDIDIAIINNDDKSGNKIKSLIRSVEKEMTVELSEIYIDSVTSKGSQFRKTVHEYNCIDPKNKNNKIIVEINSFANPFPYTIRSVRSFIYDYLLKTKNTNLIKQYNLQSFQINVLDKAQTLLEKLASLIRFSLHENYIENMKKKIRHFYDLYFLINDVDCNSFLKSENFNNEFYKLLTHDKEIFDEPIGWQKRPITESPLLRDFTITWDKLISTYKSELSALAFTPIPDEKEVARSFKELVSRIQ